MSSVYYHGRMMSSNTDGHTSPQMLLPQADFQPLTWVDMQGGGRAGGCWGGSVSSHRTLLGPRAVPYQVTELLLQVGSKRHALSEVWARAPAGTDGSGMHTQGGGPRMPSSAAPTDILPAQRTRTFPASVLCEDSLGPSPRGHRPGEISLHTSASENKVEQNDYTSAIPASRLQDDFSTSKLWLCGFSRLPAAVCFRGGGLCSPSTLQKGACGVMLSPSGR